MRQVSLSFPDARGVVASHTDGPALYFLTTTIVQTVRRGYFFFFSLII